MTFFPLLFSSRKMNNSMALCAEVSHTKISVHGSKSEEKMVLSQQIERAPLAQFLGEISGQESHPLVF